MSYSNLLRQSTRADAALDKETGRSGEIDFFRFVCSVCIVCYHFGADYGYDFFAYGAIMVEFFFLVSGYLMARHVSQMKNRPQTWGDIADSTWKFILKKASSFYRYYFCVIILNLVVRMIIIRKKDFSVILRLLLKSIPTFTLTFMGINREHMSMYAGNTWYLSAMLIAMFVLFPLLLKQFRLSAKVLFPLIAMTGLSYLYINYGEITVIDTWNGYFYTGTLRAIAEIALGVSLFPLSKWLSQKYHQWVYAESVVCKTIISLVKVMFYIAFLSYAYGDHLLGNNHTLPALTLCAAGLVLTFADIGYSIPDGTLTRWLGKISLGIFIFHGFIRLGCQDLAGSMPVSFKMTLAMIVTSILLSVGLMYATDYLTIYIKSLFTTGASASDESV